MLARWIATVAALLLACASPQASAYVRAERVSVSLADLAVAERLAPAVESASPAKTASTPKTAPPARARAAEPASGKNAALTHCRIGENWSPLQKCASMPGVYQWDGTRLAGRTNATGTSLGDYQHAYGWAISSREGLIRSTLHTDVHGTPQLITDGTAAIAGWTRTDVWGVEKAQSGTQSRLGHTGYLKDPLLGDELYAQARQYRAGVGRFTSRDEWGGDNLSPITLNKYLGFNGNPGSYLDPDGRCSVQLELAPCDLRRNAAFLPAEAADTQNRIADIADAKLAAKASPAVTGISRSVVKNVKAGVQLFADAAYTIPEQMLPQSWDRGSRVRLGGAMEGLAGWAGSPYDTTQQQYVEGLDRAAELRASGRTFEADVAEWEAHTDLASMAFGAQQVLRSGAKYAGRQLDNYVGKLDFDAREIDAQMQADAAAIERAPKVNLEGGAGDVSAAIEATPTPTPPKPACFGTSTCNDYRETFFEANPALRGKVVVHHAVEQQTLDRFPTVVTKPEINSLENLRGIPKAINSDVHLSKIRIEWNRFYRQNPNPTQAQLLEKATEIDDKFGAVFTPPVR